MHFHSSIGSNEKSALLSAPHTDHRFLSLLLRKAAPLNSTELRRDPPDDSASSALYFASSWAAICAASSASGMSSMVSSELIDGDRDLNEEGVLGILDAKLNINEAG